tara:strand:+ start:2281 stop:2586 length:306 start_codon:yes stop_codon:yes gene_type:complete
MPLEYTDFPVEVQVAFSICALLSDVWDGMSGSYLGKDWAPLEYYFKLFEVDEPKVILGFMQLYESILMAHRAEEAEKERKKSEQKAKAKGSGNRPVRTVRG